MNKMPKADAKIEPKSPKSFRETWGPNTKNNQTTNDKYFAGGDAINGGAEVVNGAYDGKIAAQGIHKWLTK